MPGAGVLRRKRIKRRKLTKKQILKPKLDTKEDFIDSEQTTGEIPPRSFVLNDGHVDSGIHGLISDFKKVMAPNTAKKVKALHSAKLKDFVWLAGGLKVSHLLFFSQTHSKVFLKIARLPRGPTLKFDINNFSLLKDVLQSQRKPVVIARAFTSAPVVVTNLKPNEGENHMQLTAQMFLDMFPSINAEKGNLNNIRRCVLLNYNEEREEIEFAHYCIRRRPIGLSKPARNLVAGRTIPNLGNLVEISDYMLKSGIVSDSEVDEDCKNEFLIKKEYKDFKVRKTVTDKSAVRLHEIGPRLIMKLVKIEDGLCTGTVLYPLDE